MDRQINERQRLRWERGLVQAAQRGDRQAFGELYRAYAPTVFAQVLLPRLGQRAAAEDALGETFRTAFEKLHAFEPDRVSVYFWFSRIAMNKAADMHRAKGTTGRALANLEHFLGPVLDVPPQPDSDVERRQSFQTLRQRVALVLDELHPRYAKVLRLRFLDDLPRDKCAEVLEVTLATFDVLLLRSLRAFRKLWDARADGREEEAHG